MPRPSSKDKRRILGFLVDARDAYDEILGYPHLHKLPKYAVKEIGRMASDAEQVLNDFEDRWPKEAGLLEEE